MVLRRFVPEDVLSLRKFCPAGCFVSEDVLSLRTFCPTGRFVQGMFCPKYVLSRDVLSLWTFCLRTFCLCTSFYIYDVKVVLAHIYAVSVGASVEMRPF